MFLDFGPPLADLSSERGQLTPQQLGGKPDSVLYAHGAFFHLVLVCTDVLPHDLHASSVDLRSSCMSASTRLCAYVGPKVLACPTLYLLPLGESLSCLAFALVFCQLGLHAFRAIFVEPTPRDTPGHARTFAGVHFEF
ncbi:unnamed protein product [Citrullus colocynthis]|uniref:Uncharacterized protein n=1 Tax=Citrullus colocynthis TaxID=252529 RepID=A0ABP0YZH9_9ROSI